MTVWPLSARAAGIVSTIAVISRTRGVDAVRASGRGWIMSVAFLRSRAVRLVMGCGVAQLPHLGGTQFVGRLVDQVRRVKLIVGVKVRLNVADQVSVGTTVRYLVAQL